MYLDLLQPVDVAFYKNGYVVWFDRVLYLLNNWLLELFKPRVSPHVRMSPISQSHPVFLLLSTNLNAWIIVQVACETTAGNEWAMYFHISIQPTLFFHPFLFMLAESLEDQTRAVSYIIFLNSCNFPILWTCRKCMYMLIIGDSEQWWMCFSYRGNYTHTGKRSW